ncbi:uncharacterized protein LOC144160724 [Haemaphysalis longicornis]
MSFSGLAPPPPFLPAPGRPSLPWEEWEQSLTVYLLASGAAEFLPERRKAILLHCLGAEGQRIYRTLPAGSSAADRAVQEKQEKPPAPATDEYESALIALRQQFSTSWNVVVERHRLYRRSQHAGDSFHDSVAGLRELGSHCSFASQDDALRDRFVAGVASNRARERLLLEGSSLSFESAVQIALQFEQAAEELKEFSASVEPVSMAAHGTPPSCPGFPRGARVHHTNVRSYLRRSFRFECRSLPCRRRPLPGRSRCPLAYCSLPYRSRLLLIRSCLFRSQPCSSRLLLGRNRGLLACTVLFSDRILSFSPIPIGRSGSIPGFSRGSIGTSGSTQASAKAPSDPAAASQASAQAPSKPHYNLRRTFSAVVKRNARN